MYLFCLLLALNMVFVKFTQVAAGISSLFLYIAVHYLQIHNLPFVKDILVVSFFIITGKTATNISIPVCWLAHIHTQEQCSWIKTYAHLQLY